jgi:predicted nucleic acid-binding Zn ribbon protein
VTEVADPPVVATERACPHCGAPLAPDQEWCLNCGAAVGTRIARTPRWRLPVFLLGGLLALIAAALVLALVELSGDPQPVAKAPSATATATPAGAPADDGGSAAPVAGATPTPVPTAVPSVTPTPSATPDDDGRTTEPAPGGTGEPDGSATGGGLATWPADKTGWTAVLASTKSRSEAEKKARAAGGGEIGVLRSDDFKSLRKGYWVVFSGQFDSRSAAESAAESAAGDAYARQIVPR